MKIHLFDDCNENNYEQMIADLDASVVELKMKLKIERQRNDELLKRSEDFSRSISSCLKQLEQHRQQCPMLRDPENKPIKSKNKPIIVTLPLVG